MTGDQTSNAMRGEQTDIRLIQLVLFHPSRQPFVSQIGTAVEVDGRHDLHVFCTSRPQEEGSAEAFPRRDSLQ
jgi:hypothetical protein